MSTSTPNKPPEPSTDRLQRMAADYDSFVNTVTLATLFVAPALIALPPRKLDFYTFSLASVWILSANYRGTFSGLKPSFLGMPAKAREIQEQQRMMAQAREQKRLLEESGYAADTKSKKGTLLGEKAKEIWMGGETEGWKERRLKEEQEKIDQGEGYGSMIMDQIWDVWNQGKKYDEETGKEIEKKP
ncbi:hypothetical protein PV10_04834 [Exophiala mesophila]|uniref:Uncharacterized protein n=1 Tax=Exophiala mesophila TaxID=212818 RepID=A0A0D1XZF2_EXOME|nr:uncharacterized protein PV10_04834 [Exophiala mesophila]KIV93636.1 hypothetical protein PV10_04834 [Exophiala mesophila]